MKNNFNSLRNFQKIYIILVWLLHIILYGLFVSEEISKSGAGIVTYFCSLYLILLGLTTFSIIKRHKKLLYLFAVLHFFCLAPLTSLVCASSVRVAKEDGF